MDLKETNITSAALKKMDYKKIWQLVLDELNLSVSKPIFQTLFSQTNLLSYDGGVGTISCPNPYVQNLIETRYYSLIKNIFDKQTKENTSLVFIVKILEKQNREGLGPLFEKKNEERRPIFDQETGLNPKYTFSSFVVGNSNNLAYAAAQAIVQNPGTVYNPFFIWGGVGVGKTHLMQAIGHEILKKTPDAKILYAPSESFVNDLIQAIKDNRSLPTFKKKYRGLDLLLIDDIQFIAGKESSQEEFFHTFNSLYLSGKQIILTSDRPPTEITKVEERLVSRFMGGLTVDIQSPDYEMRVAILRSKCQERAITISDDIIEFLAQIPSANSRELEGLLIRAITQVPAGDTPLTLTTVKQFFGDRTPQKTIQNIQPKNIIQTVSNQFQIKTNDLLGSCRKAEMVLPRQVIMYLLREELNIPLAKIGELLGGRDHTTIIHGVEKIKERFANDNNFKKQILTIKQILYE